MGALWWSYQHLDEQVRRCFAYCSIYPRRRRLKRNELVQLWMAEGFIKTTNAEEEPDGVGQDYFDELLSASFLQLAERKMEHGCEVDYFTVHDLLRDLAEEAAIGDCFKIEEGFRGEVPPDVRHIFVGSCDRKMLTEKIFPLQNLRTLIMDHAFHIELTDAKFLEHVHEVTELACAGFTFQWTTWWSYLLTPGIYWTIKASTVFLFSPGCRNEAYFTRQYYQALPHSAARCFTCLLWGFFRS
jgi:hypothetical protein